MRLVKPFSVMIVFFLSLSAKSQVITMTDNDLLTQPALHWYGLDFSNTVIFDATQIGKEETVRKTVFIEWQAYFNKHVSDAKLKRWFRKSVLLDHRKKFYKSHENLDLKTLVRGNLTGSISDNKHVQEVIQEIDIEEDELVSVYNELSLTHLDSCIKSYDLDETYGLGAIIIVERMSKLDKGTYVVGVFFDISSREILFAVRDKGAWDSYGFVAVYGSGINDGVARVGDKFRRKALKQFK